MSSHNICNGTKLRVLLVYGKISVPDADADADPNADANADADISRVLVLPIDLGPGFLNQSWLWSVVAGLREARHPTQIPWLTTCSPLLELLTGVCAWFVAPVSLPQPISPLPINVRYPFR